MKIIDIIENETYKKLIEYACEKCDTISLKKYSDQNEDSNGKALNVMFTNKNCSVEDIVKNYSDKYLDELFSQFEK